MAVPALVAVPVPHRRGDDDRTPDLTGTTWEGQDGQYFTRFVFEPGGVLFYSYKNGTFRSGSWKVEGNALYFEMNQRFREFKGTVQGDTITGDSWNQPGMRWQTTIRKVGEQK
jgi:hypothetical protein